METMATTSESADKSKAFKVFEMLKDKGPTHNPECCDCSICRHLPAMVNLMKSLSVKGFGIVIDCTDTYLTLAVQSCEAVRLQSFFLYACQTASL